MKWRRIVCVSVLFLLLGFLKNTEAEESYTINIRLKDIGTSMESVRFDAYQVGAVKEQQPVIEHRFQISDFPKEAYRLDIAARKISEMLTEKADRSGSTNTSGILSFDGLKSGVYLIQMVGENPYGTVAPFLVSLPGFENGEKRNVIEAEPKASPPKPLPSDIRADDTMVVMPTVTPAGPLSVSADNVKTGDFIEWKPYVILAALALAVCKILLTEKKGANM